MKTDVRCRDCGRVYDGAVVADRFGGVCPRCLVGFALLPTDAESPTLIEEDALPLKPGSTFRGMEVLEVVGRGGMGVVYRARQPDLGRIVALKVLAPKVASAIEFAARFQREATAMAALSHPNIVGVHEFGYEGGVCFLIMEFVEGESLRDRLHAKRPPTAEALRIIGEICDALEYAHRQGVVHRDIKPENVLIDRAGRVKIADFGLAKVRGDAPLPTLTRSNIAMGTPHYMAPEQYESMKDVDHRADIYSLGVMFYEMLTGDLPVGAVEKPSKKARVDARLDDVVFKAMHRRRERRYQHASQVKVAVEHVATKPAVAVRWNWALVVAVALVGLWQLVARVWGGWGGGGQQMARVAMLGGAFAFSIVGALLLHQKRGRMVLAWGWTILVACITVGSIVVLPQQMPAIQPREQERTRIAQLRGMTPPARFVQMSGAQTVEGDARRGLVGVFEAAADDVVAVVTHQWRDRDTADSQVVISLALAPSDERVGAIMRRAKRSTHDRLSRIGRVVIHVMVLKEEHAALLESAERWVRSRVERMEGPVATPPNVTLKRLVAAATATPGATLAPESPDPALAENAGDFARLQAALRAHVPLMPSMAPGFRELRRMWVGEFRPGRTLVAVWEMNDARDAESRSIMLMAVGVPGAITWIKHHERFCVYAIRLEDDGQGVFASVVRSLGEVMPAGPPVETHTTYRADAAAVDKRMEEGLAWLGRHQQADGGWSRRAIKCSCREATAAGASELETTSLVMLAYLGAGYSHLSPPPQGDIVKRGLMWLMNQLRAARASSEVDALGVYALVEAYGLTGSNLFKEQSQSGLDGVMEHLREMDRRGQDELKRPGGIPALFSTSQLYWSVFAMWAGKLAGLTVDVKQMESAVYWLGTKAEGGGQPEAAAYVHTQRLVGGPVSTSWNAIVARLGSVRPDNDDAQLVAWTTAAIHTNDGADSARWNAWQAALLTSRVPSGTCESGSFDHAEERVRATALGVRCLQMRYLYGRFKPK